MEESTIFVSWHWTLYNMLSQPLCLLRICQETKKLITFGLHWRFWKDRSMDIYTLVIKFTQISFIVLHHAGYRHFIWWYFEWILLICCEGFVDKNTSFYKLGYQAVLVFQTVTWTSIFVAVTNETNLVRLWFQSSLEGKSLITRPHLIQVSQ